MGYRAAIIGLGKQSIENHIPGLNNSCFAQLEAICDIDQEKLREYQEKLKVKGYQNYHELLSSEDLDFIIVATPHDVHRGIIEEAAKRRVHVLKEKPFARNLDEAFYFKRLCSANGIQLMTTLQRRFHPIYTSFFQLKNQIGNPFFVEIRYTLFIDQPNGGWRGTREKAGGGCIIDMGYHMIDMIIWYFGCPDSVFAEFSSKALPDEKYDAEDTAIVMFRYASGLYGSLILSRYCSPKTEQIRVLGNEGIIEIERGKIKRLKNNGAVVESLERNPSWASAANSQIDYFCRVISGECENIGNPDYHLQHVSFIEACYKSKLEGKFLEPKGLVKKDEK